ncbi:DNA polymerase epsilon catalytic subunit [Aphelenchoides bicaudatus]|nr:DNA polymerase epsilon catalytic subunit [Aphelenchoides bicaudatus]
MKDLPLQRKTFAKDGFKAWLVYLKSKWEKQRTENRKNLALKQSDSAILQRNMTTMQKLMLENVERVRSHAWHLIQISETSIPGVYNTFAVSDGVMRRFELTVPRTFYVNDNFERSTTHGKRVEKILPRMRPYSYLYQYSINEQKYVKQLSAFNEQLCKMNINGIYETQVPLQFRAIVKLGANSNVKTLTNATRINADQMERIPHTEMPFLPMNSFQILYFYELSVNNRSAFALFNPTVSQAHLWIINQSQLDPVNVNTIFRKEYAKHIEKHGEGRLFDGTERMNITFSQAKLIKDGSRQMQQVIKALKWSQMDPILFVVQSTKSDATLKKEFPTLASYPFVRVNGAADSPSILTGLDWWTNISKLIIQHFLNSYIVLSDYWKIAEHIGIPIGNIPEDMASFALDCLYARALQQQNFVLWASPSDRPDFGGKELDNLQLETNWDNVSFKSCLSHVYDEEMFEPRNFCVEMDLGVLAITAIMQSATISEEEGVSEYIGFSTEQTNMTIEGMPHTMKKAAMAEFNDALSISGALRVLRSLCASLVRGIKPGESNVSDQLVIALYRWIRSPKSLLYDPAIEQAVFTLMRKLCLLLVTELNQLGARVAHCSFSKIVLCTGRSNLNAAMAFVDTLRMSLRRKKLFASLNLVPTRYDRLMVWLNFSNHAYITCYDPLNDVSTEDNNKAHVELQLARVLLVTGDCRRVFYNIVMYYLNVLSKQAREEMGDAEFIESAGEKFREVIAPRIFEIINKLKENHAQIRQAMETEKIPVLKAYGLTKHLDVPLEFIKCCFKIFDTYAPIQEAVADIRYQALLLVDKDEFCSQAVWSPAKVSVILEQMFCPHCAYNIDLDVCAQKHPEDENDESFVCPSCSRPLSKLLIEELLMERTKKMQISYQLQDIRCSKCKQIGNRILRTNCQFCCGPYENTIPTEEYRANLETLGEIADVYMLENLAFVVQEQQQVLKD